MLSRVAVGAYRVTKDLLASQGWVQAKVSASFLSDLARPELHSIAKTSHVLRLTADSL